MVRKLTFTIALLMLASSFSCKKRNDEVDHNTTPSAIKYKGVSFVSPPNPVEGSAFDPINHINANYTAIIPFGFVRNGTHVVEFNTNQWWGEKDEGVIALVSYAHERNIEVMIKPQIWLMGGGFTGHFDLSSESEWQAFETSYYDYIIHFAKLADSLQCGVYCIGTEFARFAEVRPAFWDLLIDSVRNNFSGEITYAANWDNYQRIPFWQKLDFVGVDAYFPLTTITDTPSVASCKEGWQPHLASMEAFQQQTNKPIVFTEYGYRSVDNCAEEPWNSDHSGNVNLAAQQNAYQALFETFWHQSWFQGGFLWKWFPDHSSAGGNTNNRFTPQNKPVENDITQWYNQ